MADLAIDFYGLTPSYSESYLRLNTRRGDDTDVSNKRVYSSGLIFGDYEYYIGLTGGDGPTYSSTDYLFVDPIPQNTLITEKSTGFNTGPNGSIDSKYFVNVGDGNVLHGTKTSLVVGNNNETGIGTQNVVILGGSNNKINEGLTQSVLINSEGVVLNQSNSTIIGGTNILSTKPINNVIHIIEGRVSEYNLHSTFNIVDGGERPIYIKSTTNVIDPSSLIVYFRK
jgi:hypothetical protein